MKIGGYEGGFLILDSFCDVEAFLESEDITDCKWEDSSESLAMLARHQIFV